MRLRIRPGGSASFQHPTQDRSRTAVFSTNFSGNRFVRVFPDGWCESAAKFRPESLAAPFEILQVLARERHIESLRHAIVVLHSEHEALLSESQRLDLWDIWGVPVFEQIWKDTALIAAECEAHDGLHLRKPMTVSSARDIVRAACACGETTPRLVASEIAVDACIVAA